jgi:hypothetical protein
MHREQKNGVFSILLFARFELLAKQGLNFANCRFAYFGKPPEATLFQSALPVTNGSA